ncbi:MAG TPA: 16S rRNA (adenine(1518)-N(6)/adenine(1519)-N(6))-dimethyltransferase RsmA, partial [Pyrinomonadaceae bacterium]|nr:16S rRNA (adenine(1518)-N(6)/adenine(1519)-N(6))-dimethyltransferase RsmA [Pyrinomonadaceae bacterium]
IRAARIEPGDAVIEIGPGRGALTEGLLAKGAIVTAIELDRDLIEPLNERFGHDPNFRVIEQDALEADFGTLTSARSLPVKLVANLPYYISTAILQNLTTQREVFSALVLMFQREVVERITAAPGHSERGFLTVLVEAAFEVERVTDVPPGAFRPMPKIWSSVVKLTPVDDPIEPIDKLRTLAGAAFAQKRKTILNNLKHAYPYAVELLNNAGIEPRRRAETLDREEWRRMLASLIDLETL